MTPPGAYSQAVFPPASRSGTGSMVREHVFAAVSIAFVGILFVWMVTAGTWRLFEAEDFGQFYDYQASSLLRGRWDVPLEGIGFEAFIHNGKYYGYFGFAPALARIALNAFFPTMWGRWSRLSLTCGCLATLVYSYVLLLESRRLFHRRRPASPSHTIAPGVFLLCIGIGTTMIFLASRAYVYHEAIIWGSGLAVGSYAHVMRYLRRPAAGDLTATSLLCFGSFFSRMSVGSGTVVTMGLLGAAIACSRTGFGQHRPIRWLGQQRSSPPLWHAFAAVATVVFVAGMYVHINKEKFGTRLDGMPFHYYNQVAHDPARMRHTGGRAVSFANLRTNADAYFLPWNVDFNRHFPWVWCVTSVTRYPESRSDIVEPFASASATATPLVLMSAVGGLWLLLAVLRKPGIRPQEAQPYHLEGRIKEDRADAAVVPHRGFNRLPVIPVLGALAGAGPVLISAGISQRYLHDFLPVLVILGALGGCALLCLQRATVRRPVLGLICVMVPISIYVNLAIALEYQRQVVWHGSDVDAPRRAQQFARWQSFADSLFDIPPAQDAGPGQQSRPSLK